MLCTVDLFKHVLYQLAHCYSYHFCKSVWWILEKNNLGVLGFSIIIIIVWQHWTNDICVEHNPPSVCLIYCLFSLFKCWQYTLLKESKERLRFFCAMYNDQFHNFFKCFEAVMQSILPDHCQPTIAAKIIELSPLCVGWKMIHPCYFEEGFNLFAINGNLSYQSDRYTLNEVKIMHLLKDM